jgi:hypothetical protein
MTVTVPSRHGPRTKECFSLLLYCWVCVCWGNHVIANEQLCGKGRCLYSHTLATAVSPESIILPSANMPQYRRGTYTKFNVNMWT